MKLLILSLSVFIGYTAHAQLSKKQVEQNINAWYADHEDGYSLTLTKQSAEAKKTRYYPERPADKNDIIQVTFKKMEIELKFSKPLDEITTHQDSLQKYLSYCSVRNIYNEISAKGWDIYPRTPRSSIDGKGVVFTSGGESVSFDLSWASYTVMGYRYSKKCHNQLAVADGSVSEDCYVSVRKRIPLHVSVTEIPLQ